MEPDVKIAKPSALCSLGMRPLLMTGLIVQTMRQHFVNPNSIEHEEFRERLWKSDETTKIYIEDSTVWKPEISGLRPAIIVKRNRWSPVKRLINNQSGTTYEGFKEYVKFWTGSHTLFCIAKEGAEAELLGLEVLRFLQFHADPIRATFKLLMFDLFDYGELADIKEATDRSAVPITIGYGWADHWVLQSHAPKLKRIAFSTLFPPFET